MPDFQYRAARSDGRIVEGRVESSSREGAMVQLRTRGLTPVQVEQAGGEAAAQAEGASARGEGSVLTRLRNRSRPPGFDDVHALTTELSIMLRAGLPLDRALRVLIGMSLNPAMKGVLEDLLKSVKGGKGLSQALQPHQALFGDFYLNMVRSGEAGGQLAEVLGQLAEHLERLKTLKGSVVSALIYPAILVVVAFISVFLMLGFVVPQFESLFDDLGDALPLPTRMVVAAGDMVSVHGWIVVVLFALLFWGGRAWLRTPAGGAWRDRRLLALPVLGEVLRKYEITRFARTMGTLLRNGVSIVPAIRIATDTMGNTQLRGAMSAVVPTVKGGQRMAQALESTGMFTPLVLNMVRLGEETGRLDDMLLEVARVHDGQVQTGIKRALQLVEPMLILLLGGVIALIIISILMGILSVNELAV
ncbi:MAG: type II secretion system F family protein [Rhodocyclaceae bacterium]